MRTFTRLNLLKAVHLSASAHIIFHSHWTAYKRNDYKSVWYYKRLQYTQITDDMPAENLVFKTGSTMNSIHISTVWK